MGKRKNTEPRPPKEQTSMFNLPGRPARDPMKKVGRPQRFLTTVGVEALLSQAAEAAGLQVSDYMRLGLLERLIKDGWVTTAEQLNDTTWENLRLAGLINPEMLTQERGEKVADNDAGVSKL